MAKLMAYYNDQKVMLMTRPRPCDFHAGTTVKCVANQIHHSRGRLGPLLLDTRFYKYVCNAGHAYIGDNPEMARGDGLLCAKGEWNTPPKDSETQRLWRLIEDLTA